MRTTLSVCIPNQAYNRSQAYMLLLLGGVFLALAQLRVLSPYPVGELLFGLSMLVASVLNPSRFMAAGWLASSIGVATVLIFGHFIPASQVLTAHILAIGLGLLGITWMTRRGYLDAGALTPALLVIVVAAIEYLVAVHLTPTGFVPFMLSLWLPGLGLPVLGLAALAMSGRNS
jgi:hypothetical protein